MDGIDRVTISVDEVDHAERQGDKSIIVLKTSKPDVDWGHIYHIEIVHGMFKDKFYGYFGYKRNRIIEI